MKTIFLNKTQIKIFLILILLMMFLSPLADSGYRDKGPTELIMKVFNFGKENFVDNFSHGTIFYNILFAYMISILGGYAIINFKSWRQYNIIHKIVSTLSIVIVTAFILYILLISFMRFVTAVTPSWTFFHSPLNLNFTSRVNAQTLTFLQDLVHLKNINSDLTRAYDKISIQESWDVVNESGKSLSPVIIGILDTGLDKSHPEFKNVKTGSSRGVNLRDPDGHGTAVAGIIGANNILGSGGTLPVDSPQMNGIVSGILSIDYTIEMRAYVNTEKIPLVVRIVPESLLGLPPANAVSFGTFVENLDLAGAQVVNMSFGGTKCSAIPLSTRLFQRAAGRGCIPDEDFAEATKIYEEIIKVHDNILFVAGAGNDGVDASFTTPANVNADNLITVGATDLDDERAVFSIFEESNFGSSVDISAPGTNVYAPLPRGHEDANFPLNLPQSEKNYTTNFGGTSAAAPMITGTAAILKAIDAE